MTNEKRAADDAEREYERIAATAIADSWTNQDIFEEGYRAALSARADGGKDSERLDWIARQGPDFCAGIIADAPGDGNYTVNGMTGTYGEGKTFREAIDAAIAGEKK